MADPHAPTLNPGSRQAASTEPIVVRLPNWVGDVCMALPTLASLSACGPLHCFGPGWAQDLLAGLPYHVQKLPRGLLAGAKALRSAHAQRAVLLTNSFSSALQARLAGLAPLGYRGDARSLLLATGVKRPAGIHEVEAFWRLATVFRGTLANPGPMPPAPGALTLPLSVGHRAAAQAACARVGLTNLEQGYTVLCPLAVGLVRGRSKQWPGFPLLCRSMVEAGEVVVACPGPGESRACAAALPGALLLDGLGLGAYAGVMAGAKRVLANDSGPMHLAMAVGAPVLGIFGVTDPARTRPWGGNDGTGSRGDHIGSAYGWPTVQAVWERLAVPTT